MSVDSNRLSFTSISSIDSSCEIITKDVHSPRTSPSVIQRKRFSSENLSQFIQLFFCLLVILVTSILLIIVPHQSSNENLGEKQFIDFFQNFPLSKFN